MPCAVNATVLFAGGVDPDKVAKALGQRSAKVASGPLCHPRFSADRSAEAPRGRATWQGSCPRRVPTEESGKALRRQATPEIGCRYLILNSLIRLRRCTQMSVSVEISEGVGQADSFLT